MNVLIFGRDGMVGRELEMALTAPPQVVGKMKGPLPVAELAGAFGSEVDIADREAVARCIRATKPDLVVNAAAYNQVDLAEQERDVAYRTNATGPQVLAELSVSEGFRLIHYSTNFVFDGTLGRAYRETDGPRPLSHYGHTKLGGDRYVLQARPDNLVIRTAWIFSEKGRNFLRWAYDHRNDPVLHIVSDQVGNPTYSRDLAAFTLWAAGKSASGLVNFTNAGACSKYELVCEMVRLAGGTAQVQEAASADFHSLAERPEKAALDLERATHTLGYAVPTWQDAVQRFVKACQTQTG